MTELFRYGTLCRYIQVSVAKIDVSWRMRLWLRVHGLQTNFSCCYCEDKCEVNNIELIANVATLDQKIALRLVAPELTIISGAICV